MQKIVINDAWGGFYLNNEQAELYRELGGDFKHSDEIPRDCDKLVRVVEYYPDRGLKIVDIPDGVEWQICDYDGREWVAERHRIWD